LQAFRVPYHSSDLTSPHIITITTNHREEMMMMMMTMMMMSIETNHSD